jgi:N-acetylglucosamine-6-sulfatase
MSLRVGFLGFLIVLSLSFSADGAATKAARTAAQPAPPNIILILTDDEDWKAHEYLPRVRRLLEERGATFNNYFVGYSLCCPSRASILRGQYPHNTGVLGNHPPDGGFERFYRQGLESSTLATWLHERGYYTALAGKYLNGYGSGTLAGGAAHVPPGWTDWFGLAEPSGYFDYRISDGGRALMFGHADSDYLTDVLREHAIAVIRAAHAGHKPLFLYLAPKAPHLPAEPAPRHHDLFGNVELPRGASFDEDDVSDKPAPIRSRPRLSAIDLLKMQTIYRNRLQSLQSVDEMVEAIVDELGTLGELENTYILYTSDNGWHMGEHRLGRGKNTPYEEDIRVPLVIRGPGIAPGTVISQLALNSDLAPTIAELAGAKPPDFVDGRSLIPLWRGGAPGWRSCLMVQRGANADVQADEGDELHSPWGFHALRTAQYKFTIWANGDRELYDLLADPAELRNLAGSADPVLMGRMTGRLEALAKCRGGECRRLENAPLLAPEPPPN